MNGKLVRNLRLVVPPRDVLCLSALVVNFKVDASKVGQGLYPLVIAEKGAGSQGGLSIGARALNAFRELYRYTWDEPRVSGRERKITKNFLGALDGVWRLKNKNVGMRCL